MLEVNALGGLSRAPKCRRDASIYKFAVSADHIFLNLPAVLKPRAIHREDLTNA